MITIGMTIGRLTVVARDPRKARNAYWRCRCVCGRETSVSTPNLKYTTRSCGCLNAELRTTHGANGSIEYVLWAGMIQRCYTATHPSFLSYGGRGIRVCERWRRSFSSFLDDMGHRPAVGLSLDRIDNDGNYEPGNVRWATQSEQSRNKRTNHLVTYDGRTAPLIVWAEEVGLEPNTLHTRLSRGWPVERALTEPVRFSRRAS